MPQFDFRLTKQDFKNCNWQEIIANCETKNINEYFEGYSNRAKEQVTAGNQKCFEVFSFLAIICLMYLKPESNDSPFVPFMSLPDGTRSMLPEDLSEEALTVLEELSLDIVDAEMKARVTDILWLKRRDYKMAMSAVESYIQTAKLLEGTRWEGEVFQRIERALQLSITLRNKALIEKVITHIEERLITNSDKATNATAYPALLMQILQKYKKGDFSKYAELSDRLANLAKNESNWHLAELYFELKAKWHQLGKDEDEKNKALLQQAEVFVEEAFAATKAQPSKHLIACVCLEKSIEILRRVGGQQERITELQTLLIDYGQKSLEEMNVVSVEFDVGQYREQSRNEVKGLTLRDALLKLSLMGRSPSLSQLRQEVDELIKDHPMQFLVQRRVFNDMGKVVDRRPTLDEEYESLLISQMFEVAIRHQDIQAVSVIEPALQQINMEHHSQVSDLLPLVANNPFVPPGHEYLYAKGLHAGLMRDYLLAAHLLIPQLEQSMRFVLQQAGVITSMLTAELIQDEYPLSTIIYRDELKEILGEDIVFDLRGLLVERAGSNFRNLMSHGLMTAEDFSNVRLAYLWWLTLRLCCLPILAIQRSTKNIDSDTQT